MAQKIFAARADDPQLSSSLVQVKVDQVVLARRARPVFDQVLALGTKKCAVETAITYDSLCVTDLQPETSATSRVPREVIQLGMLVARPGIGFPPAVHLERFGSPARLLLTDDPRLSSVGGAGMLPLVASPNQLAEALVTGSVHLRPPRSVQVLLSDRLRPFVCVRDVALELLRRGLAETVREAEEEHQAPIVIEFSGPSARLLSVPERAILCNLAPQLGAAAALFVSDEKTEVFLRDQRRSKAHRGLIADPGAPTDGVLTVDLSAVDPLLMGSDGVVMQVRELQGEPVSQAILGGDSGVSLRDLLTAAALLKSKRVPQKLDFLLAPPSRQALEVLAQDGSLADLIATGARLLEPDGRLITGELYPPEPNGLSLRTFDTEPGTPSDGSAIVCSAETVAYAVASGTVGDPRSFKRPVRVTVPRSLPTDDVLILRKPKAKAKSDGGVRDAFTAPAAPQPWNGAASLAISKAPSVPTRPSALILANVHQIRWALRSASSLNGVVRAIIAPKVPSSAVAVFAGQGMLVLTGSSSEIDQLAKQSQLSIPAAESWKDCERIPVTADSLEFELDWAARDAERIWTLAGAIAVEAPPRKK